MTETSSADRAEAIVARAASAIITPKDGECLPCFVVRMLEEFDCDNTLRFARAYRDTVMPGDRSLEHRLNDVGGHCDCEMFLNYFQVAARYWTPEREVDSPNGYAEIIDAEPPATMPACLGPAVDADHACGVWR